MAWIVLSTVFVVSFPTLASAMTGYSGNSKAYIQDANDNLVPWGTNMVNVNFIIYDGWRVNLTGNYPILDPDQSDGPYFSLC
jgi:hypothetical protein